MIDTGPEAVPAADFATIAAQGSPVLCFDTCTALDLLRNPTREEIKPHDRTAALDLLAAAEQGRLIVLMADQVALEIRDNLPSVEDDAVKGLRKFKDQFQRVQALDVAYGGTGPVDLGHLGHLDDHVVRARWVFDRWVACAGSVQPSGDVTARAFLRVTQGRTPARPGNQSMKDCVVVETVLEAVAALRSAGLASAVVFASSNTKDYTAGPGSGLRTDLAQDFAAINMAYAPNWSAAKHSLGL